MSFTIESTRATCSLKVIRSDASSPAVLFTISRLTEGDIASKMRSWSWTDISSVRIAWIVCMGLNMAVVVSRVENENFCGGGRPARAREYKQKIGVVSIGFGNTLVYTDI